jgi:hypothetical protein
LALVIGLGGGAAIAAAAGARRTETAYPRFVHAQHGYDLYLQGLPDTFDPDRALERVAAMPEVAQSARVDLVAARAVLPSGRRTPIPELIAVTDLSDRWGFELNRFRPLSGAPRSARRPAA